MTTADSSKVIHYYRRTVPHHSLLQSAKDLLTSKGYDEDSQKLTDVHTENCFNVEVVGTLDDDHKSRLEWLLAETFDKDGLCLEQSTFKADSTSGSSSNNTISWFLVLEFGPRMTFTSAFSSNAVSICDACGLSGIVKRLERSKRYQFVCSSPLTNQGAMDELKGMLHDRMTEQVYMEPIQTFESGATPKPVAIVPIMKEGRKALERINQEMGLGFDDFDLDYYTELFQTKLGRDPTDVECFDMGQSNSEHSRHWFFGGKMIIDGEEKPHTLFQMVKATLPKDKPNNSIIAFHDNSSAIRGYECRALKPTTVDQAGPMKVESQTLHPILTAETHNFPCGVAPFPGAETGTGGRLRDVMATGRGAYPIAGVSSYCVGNLHIPGYTLPWEEEEEKSKEFVYPSNLASPLDIEIQASHGASDYGNKYGEPVIHGFTRSFGQRLPNGERFEWVKPIMFSAGVGQMDDRHKAKGEPTKGMLVVKLGGPCYRIGIGGGAASSRVQTEDDDDANNDHLANLDFDAVQRGDAEMENRMNRLMRACCDLGDANPIISVHDQGAGGNGNVLKEIVEPAGALYDIRKVYLGDPTLSVLEIWGSEYQENNALLIEAKDEELFKRMAQREHCPVRILGEVTGDGRVVVQDSKDGTTPVDLPLELVLGKMPQKTFTDSHSKTLELQPLTLPNDVTVSNALHRVLRLLSVGSKRFLVHKVDRSVTGLIAQQQCVGPLLLPLADVGVTAHTHFGITGTAVACGEQPIKGLVNSSAMARMSVAEAMTNVVWAKLSKIEDIKASGNWMYAAKLPGEGSKMYDACEALRDAFLALGCGIDGGKDSLSMAAKCGTELVKAPGELTITAYCTCEDITKTVTPDLKCRSSANDGSATTTSLLYVDLSNGQTRLGGSALAQVYKQIGNVSPDVEDFQVLKDAFNVTQTLIEERLLLSGHDRSDGGLIVTLLEMAFGGNCSIDVTLPSVTGDSTIMETLFSEEIGWVIEVHPQNVDDIVERYTKVGVTCSKIGSAIPKEDKITITIGDECVLEESMTKLRDIWEETSFQLEMKQRNPTCVQQEQQGLSTRQEPQWKLTFDPKPTPLDELESSNKPKVAVIRQEGSNGDREMLACLYSAGFDVWDVTVRDMLSSTEENFLDQFKGIVFVGGFSYADVLDSAKGWAGVIKFNKGIYQQFEQFKNRSDTFSLGVCNGCQLMALLGWIPQGKEGLPETDQPRLLENESELFESRFSSVTILESPSIMLKGMEGSSLGIWVAHGEGRFHFPKSDVLQQVTNDKLAPLRYVNDTNEITEQYPFNPNGSPQGIAALCSQDGRHLAMMPHPERCFTTWQWPWKPSSWDHLPVGPWLQMFQNARAFCEQAKE